MQKASDIKEEGASFIKESIQMHLAASNAGSFQQQLTTLAQHLIPFTEKVTKSYLQDLNKEAVDPVLQQRHPQGLNYHGVIAAAIMECCLKVLGIDAQLAERTDLDPRVTLASTHAIVIVTGQDGVKYVVDPCYLQFHKDVCLIYDQLPKDPVLVLKECDVVPYVKKNLLALWEHDHNLFLKDNPVVRLLINQKDQEVSHLFAQSPDFEEKYRMKPKEWIETSFVRAWEWKGYTKPNSYRVYNEIFAGQSEAAKRTYNCVKGLGIASLMGRISIADIEKQMSAIQSDQGRLRKNDLEAITLFSQYYLNSSKYSNI